MATSAEHTSKSTPGPWAAKWSKYEEGVFVVQAGMPSNRVLARFDGDGDGPDDQEIADARLIAAAPDLLASVKQLLAVYWGDGDGQSPDPYCIQQAKDAISKAEGR